MEETFAFSIDRVSRLTGLTVRQLRYWDKTNVFVPEYANGDRRQAYSRVYSFRDVVGLRTLAQLRQRVPLQELRHIGRWLKERYDAPWSSLRFYLRGRRVFFTPPGGEHPVATRPPGQMAFATIEMQAIAQDTRKAIERLRTRGPDEIGQISRHRHVMSNAPVLAGTRTPTSVIWDFHAAGYGTDEILRQYPHLTSADVDAAIAAEEGRLKQAG